jgi:uncharacterized protein YcfJ
MTRIFVSSVALLAAAASAQAYEGYARVVAVTPLVTTVDHPTQNCWTEYQQRSGYRTPEHSYGGAVLGGVAGGLLGSRFGEGNGRVALAAVGAAVGAITGDRLANQGHGGEVTATVPVQRCDRVDNYETRTTGYRVTYEYEGRQFTTTLPYNPGSQLRVNVEVAPQP